MTHDPLAPFRRKFMPGPEPEEQPYRTLTEHEALGRAIQALSQIPDHQPLLQYELREAYETAKESAPLAELAPEPNDAHARWENTKQLIIEVWQNVT